MLFIEKRNQLHKMNDQDVETEEMRCALSAIADEMQKFYGESLASNYTSKSEDILITLLKYKTNLNLKKDQLKMLRRNLKTACIVAKTLSAAKAKETTIINNELNFANNQHGDLVKQEKKNTNMIDILKAENKTLQDKLQCFNNFIHLGYQELQNNQNESLENISSLKQLQKILCFCSQYYADHHYQIEKCAQLQQKNRFLSSKLRFLENHLESTSQELLYLRTCVKKFQNERDGRLPKSRQCSKIDVPRSEYEIGHRSTIPNFKMAKKEVNKRSLNTCNNNIGILDLTHHLNTVRQLLNDQDTLIKDLKCLSKEINGDMVMTS